ncbi:MAG: hypothetical protein AB7F43_04305 [Bacteriovoracia bacterium]
MEIFALFYEFDSEPWKTSSSVVAKYIGGEKVVRAKHEGSLAWFRPFVDSEIYDHDSIATMSDSTAEVVFNDGTAIQIQPDSLMVFEQPPKRSGFISRLRTLVGARDALSPILKSGSVIKTKQGTSNTPFEIKVVTEEGKPPVFVQDKSGDSIFKVSVGEGNKVFVDVQSGTIDVKPKPDAAVQRILPPDKPLLVPPKLHKPRVKIRTESSFHILDLFITSAYASEKAKKLVIELEWDEVALAKEYHLQIGTDEKFSKVLVDQNVSDPNFEYSIDQAEAPEKIFYRVASIDEAGFQSSFSEIGEVELTVQKATITETKPKEHLPAVKKEKKKHSIAHSPRRGGKEASQTSSTFVADKIPKTRRKLFVSAGPTFQQRTFSRTSNPESISAVGFIPYSLAVDGWLLFNSKSAISGRASLIPAKAKTTQESLVSTTLPSSFYRAALGYQRNFDEFFASIQATMSNSSRFSLGQRNLEKKDFFLFGITFDFINNPLLMSKWNWHTSLTVYFASTIGFLIGGDLVAGLRFPISSLHTLSMNEYKGFYFDLEANGRTLSVEDGYGGAVKLGYAL